MKNNSHDIHRVSNLQSKSLGPENIFFAQISALSDPDMQANESNRAFYRSALILNTFYHFIIKYCNNFRQIVKEGVLENDKRVA